ncbi:MAG: ricin-type beta-trefoil lectin domain protein [Streptomyces sp.]|nr:ricin-type beta-trefoil lectin domain protein [Streptomyces sp.]
MRIRKRALAVTAVLAAAFGGAIPAAQADATTSAHATLGGALASSRQAGPKVVTPQRTGAYIRIDSLYSVTPGQCLDADANNGANGTKVQTWACNGSTQQEWISWDDGSVENVRFPGMCLDADTNGGGANGTKVQLWQCNGSTQQQWFVRSNDLAIYNARYNFNYNTVLDRDTNTTGNGAKAQLWVKNFQSQQWWKIVAA